MTLYTLFKSKDLENHTLFGGTYLSRPKRECPPPSTPSFQRHIKTDQKIQTLIDVSLRNSLRMFVLHFLLLVYTVTVAFVCLFVCFSLSTRKTKMTNDFAFIWLPYFLQVMHMIIVGFNKNPQGRLKSFTDPLNLLVQCTKEGQGRLKSNHW